MEILFKHAPIYKKFAFSCNYENEMNNKRSSREFMKNAALELATYMLENGYITLGEVLRRPECDMYEFYVLLGHTFKPEMGLP